MKQWQLFEKQVEPEFLLEASCLIPLPPRVIQIRWLRVPSTVVRKQTLLAPLLTLQTVAILQPFPLIRWTSPFPTLQRQRRTKLLWLSGSRTPPPFMTSPLTILLPTNPGMSLRTTRPSPLANGPMEQRCTLLRRWPTAQMTRSPVLGAAPT